MTSPSFFCFLVFCSSPLPEEVTTERIPAPWSLLPQSHPHLPFGTFLAVHPLPVGALSALGALPQNVFPLTFLEKREELVA